MFLSVRTRLPSSRSGFIVSTLRDTEWCGLLFCHVFHIEVHEESYFSGGHTCEQASPVEESPAVLAEF